MNIGVLGTGVVGETLATALLSKGHAVKMGGREEQNEKARAWVAKNNANASNDTFSVAADFGEIIFLCLNGDKTLDALRMAGAKNFDNKIVVDVTNPLDFSRGMPPTIIEGVSNNNSLGEEVQKMLPGARVVKALNTLTASLMVNPSAINDGDHNLFICGNDGAAKEKIKEVFSNAFGWRKQNILDLGDISAARTTEAYVTFWVRLMLALGSPMFNIKVVRS